MLPNVTFLALSATLTALMVTELKCLLGLYNMEVVQQSNNHTNIALIARAMEHMLQSLVNIAFLIPFGLTLDSDKPPRFVLFMCSKKQCKHATRFLCSRLPPELQDKIVWVHAERTNGFNKRAMAKLKSGELLGIVCTDVAGMVLFTGYRYVRHWRCSAIPTTSLVVPQSLSSVSCKSLAAGLPAGVSEPYANGLSSLWW
ncbi:hypothetical protein FRC12_010189 [Ceratobasidium sp. 428]|nr:hypothetical protein FRC12_010189 [Ceratobasidium sp. 428]